MNAVALLAVLGVAVQSVPPLTEAQRVQLDTAIDSNRQFDEAALYPLLHNADTWQPGDEAGAMIPDYGAILEAPAQHRGGLFLIEGWFGGVPKRGSLEVARLTRGGPWDDRLEQWVIVTDRQKDEVAVVYLLDPPPAPGAGAKVRLAARFYKVLADFDRSTPPKPTSYLLFIGKTTQIMESGSGGTATPGGGALLLLVLLAGGWFTFRHMLRSQQLRPRLARAAPGGIGIEEDPDTDEEVDIDLPKDPAEALGALNREHDESD